MQQKSMTYSLAVQRHDDGYLAFFPSLPGCHTWGPTFESAVMRAEEALAVYLETLAEHGDPIPEDKVKAPISLGVTVRNPVIL